MKKFFTKLERRDLYKNSLEIFDSTDYSGICGRMQKSLTTNEYPPYGYLIRYWPELRLFHHGSIDFNSMLFLMFENFFDYKNNDNVRKTILAFAIAMAEEKNPLPAYQNLKPLKKVKRTRS